MYSFDFYSHAAGLINRRVHDIVKIKVLIIYYALNVIEKQNNKRNINHEYNNKY